MGVGWGGMGWDGGCDVGDVQAVLLQGQRKRNTERKLKAKWLDLINPLRTHEQVMKLL